MKLREATGIVKNLSDRFSVKVDLKTYELVSDVDVHYRGQDLEELVSTAKYVVTHSTPNFNC